MQAKTAHPELMLSTKGQFSEPPTGIERASTFTRALQVNKLYLHKVPATAR